MSLEPFVAATYNDGRSKEESPSGDGVDLLSEGSNPIFDFQAKSIGASRQFEKLVVVFTDEYRFTHPRDFEITSQWEHVLKDQGWLITGDPNPEKLTAFLETADVTTPTLYIVIVKQQRLESERNTIEAKSLWEGDDPFARREKYDCVVKSALASGARLFHDGDPDIDTVFIQRNPDINLYNGSLVIDKVTSEGDIVSDVVGEHPIIRVDGAVDLELVMGWSRKRKYE